MTATSTGASTATSTPIVIKIRGIVPNKKDSLRPRYSVFRKTRGKGMMYDGDTRSLMDSIVIQIRAAWRNRPPVEHPRVQVQFTFSSYRRDQDGRWSTVQDALKVAGVIADDSIAHFNGQLTILPAIVDPKAEEGCEVTLWTNN